MANILLAEDDENLGFMVQDNLTDLGHSVSWAKNGEEAFGLFTTMPFDVCLIDVMMPKMDGFEVASKIRAKDAFVPLLFLTAKSMEEDRLKGFEIGGDDYILKPFSMKELSYRIKVFLRRNNEGDASISRKWTFGNSSYDPENLTYANDGQHHPLTEMEAKLLVMLLENQNHLVRREDILEQIWGENDYFKGRSLDVFITRLRKYLKNDLTLTIKNHHGVGFSLLIK